MSSTPEEGWRISRCCQLKLEFMGGLGGFWYSRSIQRQYAYCPGCDLVYAVRVPDEVHAEFKKRWER